MKRLVFATAMLATAAMVLFAADIDGTWTRETQGKGGATTQTLTLKADGSTLTGTLDAGFGGAAPISEGTLNGSNVSFKVVRDFNGNSVTQTYTGSMSGNQLTLNVEGGGGFGGKGKSRRRWWWRRQG